MKTWEKILIFGGGLALSGGALMLIGTTVAVFNNPPNSYPPPYWLLSYLVWCTLPIFGGIIIMFLSGKIEKFIFNYMVKT